MNEQHKGDAGENLSSWHDGSPSTALSRTKNVAFYIAFWDDNGTINGKLWLFSSGPGGKHSAAALGDTEGNARASDEHFWLN